MGHLIGTGGGRGNPTPAIGQVSAALTIWEWILTHGRAPKANECRNKNGLYGYDLYYRVFAASHFSTIIPMVSAICGSAMKMRTCLGFTRRGGDCPNTFPDQGAHIRLCDTCRKDVSPQEPHRIPATVERLTRKQMGVGLGGWESLDGWAQDIDWTGEHGAV